MSQTEGESNSISKGRQAYEEWKRNLEAEPGHQALAAEVAFEGNLWLAVGEARIDSGVSQEELAQKLGISVRQVRRIEKRPFNFSAKTLRRFLNALGPGYSLEVDVITPTGMVPQNESGVESKPEDQEKYQMVQEGLDALKDRYDHDRLDLIRTSFPDIASDANGLLEEVYKTRGAYYEPWEYFEIGGEENEIKKIQEKYGIHFHRQRPLREYISPQTDLFFETSEILCEQKMKEIIEKGNPTDRA